MFIPFPVKVGSIINTSSYVVWFTESPPIVVNGGTVLPSNFFVLVVVTGTNPKITTRIFCNNSNAFTDVYLRKGAVMNANKEETALPQKLRIRLGPMFSSWDILRQEFLFQVQFES